MGPRIERARQLAILGGKTIGVAATIGVLAVLWVALHAAEREWLDALLGDDEA